MRNIFTLVVGGLLGILLSLNSYAQPACIVQYTFGDGSTCPSLTTGDIEWSVSRDDKGLIANSAGTGDAKLTNVTFVPGSGILQLNLGPLTKLAAFSSGEKVTVTMKIKESASCGAGAIATVTGSYNGNVVTEGSNFFVLVLNTVVTPPSILIGGAICAGGDKTDITIGNVTDYSKYSIKVFSGATDVTDKFTIGALGATTEIKAKAGTAAGNYTVKLIDNADSSKEFAANLTVNAAAVISITVPNTQKDGANAYYCSGGSDKSTVVLTANGPSGYTYAWEKDGAAIAGAGSVTANQPGVYKVKGTHTTGCPGEATVTVGEKTAPTAPAITTPTKADVCVEDGGATTLTVASPNAGYTYIWTGATAGTPTSSATVQHSGVATTAAGSQYTVKAKDNFCTSNVSTAAVLKGHKISVTLDKTGSIQVADGVTQTLTATPTTTPATGTVDATSWNWTSTGAAIASGQGTGSITTAPIHATSTYKVAVKDQYGCPATSATTTFTIKAGTTWDITLADAKACAGTQINLAPTTTAGVTLPAPVIYAWSSSDGLTFTSTNTLNTSVPTTMAPGTYKAKIKITDGNDVSKEKEVTVKVYGNPTLTDVTVTSTLVCKGDVVELSANGGAASTTVIDQSDRLTYNWTGATKKADQTKASATLKAEDNVYDVQIVDGNTCKSEKRSVTYVGHEVTVIASLNGSTSSPVSVPFGSTGALDCTPSCKPNTGASAGHPDNYEWVKATGTAGIDGVNTNKTATTEALVSAGSFKVTVTDQFGCQGTGTINYTTTGGALTVLLNPAYICAGSDTPLSCTPGGGTGGAITYEWIAVNGDVTFDDRNAAQPKLAAATLPGVYQVKVKITQGAQTVESAVVDITVGAQPKLATIGIFQNGNLIPDDGTSVLPGSKVSVVATGTNLPAGTVYKWTPTALVESVSADQLTAESVALSRSASTCFTLTVTNAAGKCPDHKEACVPVAGTEFVLDIPDASVCFGTPLNVTSVGNITGGVKPYVRYTWTCADPNFSFTESADHQYITVAATTPVGTYTVHLEVEDTKGNLVADDFTVTVATVPAFTAVPASPQTTKVGTTVNLSATVNPGTATVNWIPGGPVQGAQTGGMGYAQITAGQFTAAGAYNYRVEATLGTCSIDSVIVINVQEKVDDIVIVAADVAACEGDGDIRLSASATGGSGSLSYRWEVLSGDIVLTSSTGQTTTVQSASVGSHRVRIHVTDNSATDPAPAQYKDILVTIYGKPTITSIAVDNVTSGASNVTVVDFGDELKLTATVDPTNAKCTWTDDRGALLSPNGNPVYTKPMTDNTRFTLTLTNNNECSVNQDVSVTVKQPENGALLRLELAKECAESGRDMVLTMTATGGTTYSFHLRNNAGLDVLFEGTGPWTYNIPLSGQDTYFAQNFQAFKNGVEILPTYVQPENLEALFYTTPVITIAGGNTKAVCEGNALTLSASAQLGNTVFEWDDPNVVNGRPFFPTTSGTYTVTATSDRGCEATSRVDVTIIPRPTVTINASPETICLGDTVFLTAGGSATEFTWNNGKTGTNIFDIPNVGGTIKYVVSGKETVNGCTDTASVKVLVNEPPMIVSTSRTTRSIAIGKNATFAVKATGKDLRYEWQRWTGSSWLTLYDGDDDQPGVSGSRTDSLTLTGVPMSWNDTKLQCIVTNDCGVADTTFLLYVKECFDILDVEWNMCEGIRPETDPTVAIDGWYCPGTKIAICAKLILDDPDADLGSAVYKWTVDGLSTDDGRWGEMVFISDSSVLSWIPPASWQDNITIALCAYIDGACDTVCKSYLRLKATAYTELDWKMMTSVDPSRMFCPGDTVTCWIEDPKQTAGLNPTYKWYNDIFDLSTEKPSTNEVVSLKNDRVVMKMGQKDTWMKVVMTPSPEICTRQGEYADTAFLQVKQIVEPEFSIWSEDTLACANDEIYLEARWKNAGEHPKFQWTRSIGEPYWNLGTEYYAKTVLDENDVWIKCVLTPSNEVCFRQDTVFVGAKQIKVIKDPAVVIFADLENKVQGDEIIIESDITKMPIKDPSYTWYVNNLIEPGETEEEWISSDFKQGDKIQLGVKGERICQNQIMSNILEIDFNNSARDTLVVIYRDERIRNLDLFKPGDELKEFSIAQGGYTGSGKVSMGLDGKFNYIPDRDFIGMEKVTYVIYNKYTGTTETGHVYIQVKDKDRFFIPNIITPNGDGLNDTWKLDFLAEYPEHRLTIYNRYGKVVFRADHYSNDWDGSGQGNSGYVAYFNLPNGIYTYVIDLGNKEILKGWVEIRKNMNLGRYSR